MEWLSGGNPALTVLPAIIPGLCFVKATLTFLKKHPLIPTTPPTQDSPTQHKLTIRSANRTQTLKS